jgi:hypothetical protein
MKHWWVDEDKTLKQGQNLVPTQEFKAPYKMLVAMLNQLYGEEKSTHFQTDWLPLAHTIVKMGQVFNWEDILAFNICLHMKNIPGMRNPCFYMSTYLIDAICSSVQFIDLRWNWDQDQPPMHVYCSELWNINYKRYFYDICNYFLTPLYTIIYEFPRHIISIEARTGMKGVADWYLGKYYSYIRVYGSTGAPHILPYFVPDHLLMREISYQTMGTWVTSLLLRSSKKLWPLFPIHIGNYTLSNGPHARKEAKSLQDVCLCLGEPKGHDPHELAVGHIRSVGLTHSNIHVVDFEEDMFKGVLFYEEVLQKLPNDVAKQELESEQEEMKKITLDQFQILLQEEKNKLNTKEQEKIKREKS